MLYGVYYSNTPKSKIENLNNLGFNGPEMENYMKDDITIEEWIELRTFNKLTIKHIKGLYANGVSIDVIAKSLNLPEFDVKYILEEGEFPPPPEYS